MIHYIFDIAYTFLSDIKILEVQYYTLIILRVDTNNLLTSVQSGDISIIAQHF